VSVYTDDIDVIGPDGAALEKTRDVMNKVWKRDARVEGGVKKVRMSQAAFFENAFDEFELHAQACISSGKFPSTPLPHNVVINKSMGAKDDAEKDAALAAGCQELAGCILWGARGCCPESPWAASQACSVVSRPSWEAWHRAIGALAHQCSARNRGIVFSGDGNPEPLLLADASFKIDPHAGKTQLGTLAPLHGGPVDAVSKKIPHVASSTPHAELCAMNHAARAGAWLENLLLEIGLPTQNKMVLLGDNAVAVLNSTEDVISEKNKRAQLAFHCIKERKEHLDVFHVGTKLMLSDILTKSASKEVFACLVGWFTGTAEKHCVFTRPKAFK
jgi:hypothetical protein